MEYLQQISAWIQLNWDLVLEFAGALYVMASIVVSWTPSPRDDQWLRRIVARLAFLSSKDVPGFLSFPGRLPLPPDTTPEDEDTDERAS